MHISATALMAIQIAAILRLPSNAPLLRPTDAAVSAPSSAVVKVTSSTGSGSGFLVRSDGTVVTAYHVIAGATTVWVHLPEGRAIAAEGVTAVFPDRDVALLKVSPDVFAGIAPIPLTTGLDTKADALDRMKGARVSTVGYPEAGPQKTSQGTLLLARRGVEPVNYFVLEFKVTSGCSGGPLLDSAGAAIGVVIIGNGAGGMGEAVEIGAVLPLPDQAAPVITLAEAEKGYDNSPDLLFASGMSVLKYWQERDKKGPIPKSALEFALHQYTQASAKRPGFSMAVINKGACELRLKRFADAEKSFREALTICSDDLIARFDLALFLASQDRDREAEDEMHVILKLSPEFAMGHKALAALLAGQGDHEGASRSFERAVKLKPDEAPLRIALAMSLMALHRPSQAVNHLEAATRLTPLSPEAHYYCGMAYAELARHREAIQSQSRAIQLRPSYAIARFSRAASYLSLGEKAKARQDYQRLRSLDSLLAARLLGLLQASKGRHRH